MVYLGLLAKQSQDRRWGVFSYCQMTNHVHVLVRTPEPDLGAGFKAIHEEFAQHFNRKYEEHGHLFGSRFHSKPVTDDRHLHGCLRYIARNPVEAAICRAPRDWRWSAHRALAGLCDAPRFLDVSGALELLDADAAAGRRVYQQLTAQSDQALLAALAGRSDAWLPGAVDDFQVPVEEIATFLGVHRATAYRRLAAARNAACD